MVWQRCVYVLTDSSHRYHNIHISTNSNILTKRLVSYHTTIIPSTLCEWQIRDGQLEFQDHRLHIMRPKMTQSGHSSAWNVPLVLPANTTRIVGVGRSRQRQGDRRGSGGICGSFRDSGGGRGDGRVSGALESKEVKDAGCGRSG